MRDLRLMVPSFSGLGIGLDHALSGLYRNRDAYRTDAWRSQGPDYTRDSNGPDQPHLRLLPCELHPLA